MAPDGEEVSLVGFTILRKGKEKKIELTKRKNELTISTFPDSDLHSENKMEKDNRIELIGTLSAADSDNHNLKLTVEGNKKRFSIQVPEGLGDIVKKYWEEKVLIKGYKLKGNNIQLIEIDHIV